MLAALLVVTALLQTPCAALGKGLNRCSLCKEVVLGFTKGLEATQGSNFGGGNTKWEEKNLGKYVASETRFVEVTEKYVCKDSEEERKCHMMFEEAEPAMEDWWFRHYAEGGSPDSLYDYLCIEQVKACCPKNTFGKHCSACPGLTVVRDASKDGKVVEMTEACSGRGECEGSGTRSGSGSCKCQLGYRGQDCGQCAANYFEPASAADEPAKEEGVSSSTNLGRRPTCLPCHQSCAGSCRSSGPDGCDLCKEGWTNTSAGCEDVNECDTTKCSEGEFCENTAGSYNCRRCHAACGSCFGASESQCLSCAAGYRIAEGGSLCADIDECTENSSICPGPSDAAASVCTNKPGSYACDCAEGYKKHPETELCTPADEVDNMKIQDSRSTSAGNASGRSGDSRGDADARGKLRGHEPPVAGHDSQQPKSRTVVRPIDKLVYFCSLLVFVVMATLARTSTLKSLALCGAYGAFLVHFANQYK